jgi:MFS family permease
MNQQFELNNHGNNPSRYRSRLCTSPKVAFALVSFTLGELGDGLNIFQGIYLVGLGWNEGSVGIALSLMGLTVLIVQAVAGDIVDKTSVDRRIFLAVASIITALSASAILFVREGNTDHMMIFITKVIEGIAGSFIGPCLAALTLANFGPSSFDKIMASNILWGHIGSVVAAILAGTTSYILYPNIKYCFLVIGTSALLAVVFVNYVPEGDPLMGRGFKGKTALDEHGQVENIGSSSDVEGTGNTEPVIAPTRSQHMASAPKAWSYREVLAEPKTLILCVTGFFFQ